MHAAVELLLASPQGAAHAFLEPAVTQFLPQTISLLARRQGGDYPVEQVQVRGDIIRRIPLNTPYIRGRRDWGSIAGKVDACVVGRRRIWSRRVRDDVEVMEENPEHFFGDVDDFFAPDTIRARVMH